MSGKSPLFILNNGIEMPALGLGVYQSSPDETVTAVEYALTSGYRLIDTAAAYFNETEVGEGFRRSGINREDVFITTKAWISDYGVRETRHAFNRSLKKLGLDYLDLYLLHWPVPGDFEKTIDAYHEAEKLLDEGRVRAIGVCNFREEDLVLLAENAGTVPAVNQVELNPLFAQPALRSYHAKAGIITQAWSPLGGVNRYWPDRPDAARDPLTDPTVNEIALRHGKTSAQVVLRWHLQNGIAVIPKSVSPQRINENIDIFDFELSHKEAVQLDHLDVGLRSGPEPEFVSPQVHDFKIED
ncbi:TPA: aldo/keto reductase [Enterobacter hormaechei subsp. steigerwaltii]|nr:aldo/keto reductase [Enterobacter hormaechei subsp. steigerwaltii]